MIVLQYICVLLYAFQMPKFTYSKAIGISKQSSNVGPIKCSSSNDQICSETAGNSEYSSVVEYKSAGSYELVVWWLPYLENNSGDNANAMNGGTLRNGKRFRGMMVNGLSARPHGAPRKAKRALELVEEHPPEGTYRPPSEREEPRTFRALTDNFPSMPSIPSSSSLPMPSIPPPSSLPMPSIPSSSSLPMPSIPSPSSLPTPSIRSPSLPIPPTKYPSGPADVNRDVTNDITTASSSAVVTSTADAEVLETTTEDYGNVGEPQCDYDPFTFVLKCSLSLITSIFGLSDTCCKPIF